MKNFLEKFRRIDQQAEKDQTERVLGLGRRTKEEIAKWNQMTALRFQTGGRHQNPWPPFGRFYEPADMIIPNKISTDFP